jgi:hypothetical protein
VEGEEKGDILRTVKGEREAGEERKMRTEIVTRQTDQRQGKEEEEEELWLSGVPKT